MARYKFYIVLYCMVDSYVMKRAEEVAQLSAMLALTTSVAHQDLNDIDETQQVAGQHLVTNLDELLKHCSQTQVCAALYLLYVELLFTTLASYIALHGRADGQRPSRWPRKRWLDGVQEDCRDRGMSLIEAFRFAEDRTTWRSTLGLSERVHMSPWH